MKAAELGGEKSRENQAPHDLLGDHKNVALSTDNGICTDRRQAGSLDNKGMAREMEAPWEADWLGQGRVRGL